MSRSASNKSSSENSLIRYFKDTRAEIAKVTWPTREEGIRLTTIVLVVTAISAVFLFGMDALFSFIIASLIQAI